MEFDMCYSFTIFKKETNKGLIWYARFWDEKIKKYAVKRSTGVFVEGKTERKREAELKAQAMISEIRFETDAGDCQLISYLEDFWKPSSPYVREQATLRKNPLSVYYVKQNSVNIKLHIKPFQKFKNLPLRELTAGMIKDWMAWVAEKGVNSRTINLTLSTMRVPVNYAYDREELDRNPFRKIKQATETPQEKGVLTFAERAKLLSSKSDDLQSKLAVFLGLLCGMRRGEVRGLKWGDFSNGLIRVTHNYVDHEGLKKPKRGKTRTVPYPSIVEKAFEEVRHISIHKEPDNFVFDSYKCPGVPMGETFFRNAIKRELEAIGISANEQDDRNISFHSLGHSFITLGRLDGISDLEIQAIAGHSTRRMMEHYSHVEKVIDFMAMRDKLDKAVEVRAAQ
jgi:integrase